MQRHLLPNTNFPYYIQGENPHLLIHSGTHGDEHESIDLVKACLKKYTRLLPSFIYVPEVSPSAVLLGTRNNGEGQDSNRIYFDNATEPEVTHNQAIMKLSHFELGISFHEDPEYPLYYIYDEGNDHGKSKLILAHNQYLNDHQIPLLTGLDDPSDPKLGHHFVDGYAKFNFTKGEFTGDTLNWGMNHGLIEHALVPEIPGKFKLSQKTFIIESIFENILISYFR